MRLSVISVSVLLIAAGCSGGGGEPDRVAPVSATQVAEAPSISWDVSPDGEWTSGGGNSELCLQKVGEDGAEECFDLGNGRAGAVRWSPDAAHVVAVPDAWRTLQPAPMVVLNIADSTLTEIVSPSDPDSIDGVAFDTAFLDNDTLIYWSMRSGDDPVTQFWSIDLDGSNQELLAEFDSFEGEKLVTLLGLLPLDGDTVLTRAGAGLDSAGLVEFDLAAGTLREVIPGGRELRPSAPIPVSAAGDVTLVADINRLGDFGRESREGGFWALLLDDEMTTVPDRGFYRTRSVAFSPDGDQLAVLETYLGRDVDGEEDPRRDDVRQSLEATRLSITTVESVLAGAPDWTELSGFSEFGTVGDLDGLVSGIVWTEPDRLWLELQGGLFEVALEPVG